LRRWIVYRETNNVAECNCPPSVKIEKKEWKKWRRRRVVPK
jgi:hypothetical protein